jgi:N-acyl-L-homoserine lactone synthetase/ubiquinone/menaquinone biosynthesis C-methylase UbiE
VIKKNHKKPYDFLGIDNSRVMLLFAKIKNSFNPFSRFALDDLNHNIFVKDSSLDLVYCINVLYTLNDSEIFLKNIYKKLRLGGDLILVNPKKNPSIIDVLKENFSMLKKKNMKDKINFYFSFLWFLPPFLFVLFFNFFVIKYLGRNQIYHFFNKEELTEMLEKFGFRVIMSEEVYGDSDILIRAIKVLVVECDNEFFYVSKAVTEEDLVASYSLRFDVYCNDINSLNSCDYPNRQEIDYYDDFSTTFIMLSSDGIIGTVRLIKDTPRGFLMEEEFDLLGNIDRSKILEASRVAIKGKYRGSKFFLLLCSAAKIWSKENGYTYWCLACQEELVNLLLIDNWKISILGSVKNYHNTLSIPLLRKI